MTAQEVIVHIRAEIERRRYVFNHKAVYKELDELLSFLSDLEKSEKPINQGLNKEIEEISIHVPCSEFTHESEYIDLLGWLKEQFTYFYDLGCRRTAEKYDEIEYNRQRAEESVRKNLEKEIDGVWKICNPIDEGMGVETANIHIEQFDYLARHFAKWGAEHLKK